MALLPSGQDGGVGRHTVPPCTTKRSTIANLKTKARGEWGGNSGERDFQELL